jgi:hypothetical protein
VIVKDAKMDEPEQKLTVEVAEIDGVHVNHINVFEARKREILEDFTSKTTSSNDEDLASCLPCDARLESIKNKGQKTEWREIEKKLDDFEFISQSLLEI